ncbi:TPA: hypothetical protein JAG59_000216 [Legionella pneumophila]|nr:hypothetical protein [Legionella pneumophila]HAT5922562.1 hypothetical protein [Legionella pneumophila]HAT5934208.1 hypothetical protein [Legionella pneumophila]HAT5949027.1 hypothetical protein [Legionella pneumophila]HAT5960106.1 hypothetical protein [Legionella pneumophila]
MAVPYEIKGWPDIENSSVFAYSFSLRGFFKVAPDINITLISLKLFIDLRVEIFYSGWFGVQAGRK